MSEADDFFCGLDYAVLDCQQYCPYPEARPEGGCAAGVAVVLLEEAGAMVYPGREPTPVMRPAGFICMQEATAEDGVAARRHALRIMTPREQLDRRRTKE